MDYGSILSRAWDIVWKNKYLLGLGFLASLTTGGGGNFNIDQSLFTPSPSGELPEFLTKGIFADIVAAVETNDPAAMMEAFMPLFAAFVPLIVLSFVLGIILWFIATAARAGLVRAAHDHASGATASGFGSYFSAGSSYIFPLLVKSIVLLVVAIVIFGILGVLSIVPFVICLTAPLFVLMFIPIMFTDAYAFRGIVLQDMGAVESLGHGWRVFRENVGASLVLGLIYGIISAIVGFALALLLSPISGLFSGPIEQLFETGMLPSGATLTLIAGGLITGLILAALMSIIVAWQSVGFTLAYRDMTDIAKSSQSTTSPDGDLYDGSWEKSPKDVGFDDDFI